MRRLCALLLCILLLSVALPGKAAAEARLIEVAALDVQNHSRIALKLLLAEEVYFISPQDAGRLAGFPGCQVKGEILCFEKEGISFCANGAMLPSFAYEGQTYYGLADILRLVDCRILAADGKLYYYAAYGEAIPAQEGEALGEGDAFLALAGAILRAGKLEVSSIPSGALWEWTEAQEARKAYGALLGEEGYLAPAADYKGTGDCYLMRHPGIPVEGFALLDINGDGIEELLAGALGAETAHDWGLEMMLVNIYTYRNGAAELIGTADVSRCMESGFREMQFVDRRYLCTFESGAGGYLEIHYGLWDGEESIRWTDYVCQDGEKGPWTKDGEPIGEDEFWEAYGDVSEGGLVERRETLRFYRNDPPTRKEILGE